MLSPCLINLTRDLSMSAYIYYITMLTWNLIVENESLLCCMSSYMLTYTFYPCWTMYIACIEQRYATILTVNKLYFNHSSNSKAKTAECCEGFTNRSGICESKLGLFFCLFVWGLSSHSRIFPHMETSNYRWRAANFDLCSALMDIEQWEFFCVSHLLWHGKSVYNGNLRGHVTLTSFA